MTTAEIIGSAFVMGLAGSLHCIGMCGPLAFSLPVSHTNNRARLAGGLIYNAGRIATYSVMGLLFGTAGGFLINTSWQAKLSIALGIMILLYLLVPKTLSHHYRIGFLNKPFVWLRQSLAKLFASKKFSSLFSIGLLNGLLPCGLVYLALGSSLITSEPFTGFAFMLFFGFGTLPAMLAAVYFGNYLNQQLRLKISRALPVFLFAMAVLLILRGMELGIPFVSPVIGAGHQHAAVSCH
jgi:hypothetical protein